MKKNVWQIINSVLIAGVIVFTLVLNNTKTEDKIVYVDNVRVFQEFEMTKELGAQNEKKFQPVIQVFDSLVKDIQQLEATLKEKKKITEKDRLEYAKRQKIVIEKEQELERIKSIVKEDINNKVWERLNGYIKEYGEQNGITLILGAQGQGNIMYGESPSDITDDFIAYANFKFEGN